MRGCRTALEKRVGFVVNDAALETVVSIPGARGGKHAGQDDILRPPTLLVFPSM